MADGWISLHRKLQEHWLWQEKRVFSKAEAWIDIIWTVNHSANTVLIGNITLKCERGESLLSLESWAKRWNWKTRKRVLNFLRTLEENEMIIVKSETVTTRITVLNYDTYQPQGNAKETQRKRRGNAKETQRNTNNNDNNENKENNEIHELQKFISENLKNVSKMQQQLTYEEAERLESKYGLETIKEMLQKMNNYKPLNKNNISVNQTAQNWLNKDLKNGYKQQNGKSANDTGSGERVKFQEGEKF